MQIKLALQNTNFAELILLANPRACLTQKEDYIVHSFHRSAFLQ